MTAILVAGFYEDPDPARCDELLECVRRNVGNEAIDEMHLLVEDELGPPELTAGHPALADAKVRLVPHGRRCTYEDLFGYASERLAGRTVVVANADIYFDHTLARLHDYDLRGRLLCLSRWNVEEDGSAWCFEFAASQDAWIFEAPLPRFPCAFHLGIPGCDNRLAWEASKAGLEITNPARSIHALHLHLSGVWRYSDGERVHGHMEEVPLCCLGPGPDLPVASVAFAEAMGYELAWLESGVSSHTNQLRPFTRIPDELAGLRFTQVVCDNAAPVEVEFLDGGKLYVLVGNDWDGRHTLTEWLCDEGFDERLPLVETAPGVGFEVWSIVGRTGEVVVVPTQAMLVAADLVARRSRTPVESASTV